MSFEPKSKKFLREIWGALKSVLLRRDRESADRNGREEMEEHSEIIMIRECADANCPVLVVGNSATREELKAAGLDAHRLVTFVSTDRLHQTRGRTVGVVWADLDSAISPEDEREIAMQVKLCLRLKPNYYARTYR